MPAKTATCYAVVTVLACQQLLLCLSFVVGGDTLQSIFANDPAATVLRLQLWRLVTATVAPVGLLGLFAATFVLIRHGSALERQHGTVAFAKVLGLRAIAAQLLYCAVVLGLGGGERRADGCLMVGLLCFCEYSLRFTSIELRRGGTKIPPVAFAWVVVLALWLVGIGGPIDAGSAVAVAQVHSAASAAKPPAAAAAAAAAASAADRLPGAAPAAPAGDGGHVVDMTLWAAATGTPAGPRQVDTDGVLAVLLEMGFELEAARAAAAASSGDAAVAIAQLSAVSGA
eukprot:SAG22_NODE_218_length_14885_cov_24.733699_7_plen_285_part_00